jgi:hypothetical protein
VDVVSGADVGAWTIAHSIGAIDDTVAEQVHAALRRYQATHEGDRVTRARVARAA